MYTRAGLYFNCAEAANFSSFGPENPFHRGDAARATVMGIRVPEAQKRPIAQNSRVRGDPSVSPPCRKSMAYWAIPSRVAWRFRLYAVFSRAMMSFEGLCAVKLNHYRFWTVMTMNMRSPTRCF